MVEIELEGSKDPVVIAIAKLSTDLKEQIAKLSVDLKAVSTNVDTLTRRVEAIESAPTPYGRPRYFHGGVGVHSVAGATPGLSRRNR